MNRNATIRSRRTLAPFSRAGDRMRHQVKDDMHEDRAASIRSLETMLDYAMIEGAQLRLPTFVYLLRAARSELVGGADAPTQSPRTSTTAIQDR
jgi:hypothetical protein